MNTPPVEGATLPHTPTHGHAHGGQEEELLLVFVLLNELGVQEVQVLIGVDWIQSAAVLARDPPIPL